VASVYAACSVPVEASNARVCPPPYVPRLLASATADQVAPPSVERKYQEAGLAVGLLVPAACTKEPRPTMRARKMGVVPEFTSTGCDHVAPLSVERRKRSCRPPAVADESMSASAVRRYSVSPSAARPPYIAGKLPAAGAITTAEDHVAPLSAERR
jgi:hypothetical protein